MLFAIVGDDGVERTVWGVGATEDEARADARRWLVDACEADEARSDEWPCVTITPEQAGRIEAGVVSCAELGVP